MSFSLSVSCANIIRTQADQRNIPRTHFVEMAVRQYWKMRARGAWTCRYTPNAHSYGPSCGHLNSRTAATCENCGQDSPQIRRKADKRLSDEWLEERGTGIPIKEISE